ncbi:MAG: DUF3291 domain-containing protein [Lysobacterales bacterium]
MANYELAQLNMALMAAPLESPELEGFVANLDRINTVAERSPGFVWRLQTEEGDATDIRPFGDEYLVNLSVWTDVDSLFNYVYKTAHVEIMRRRKEWFNPMRQAHTVLWWVQAGHRPTVEEAKAKLETLQTNGPSSEAFTFKQPFPQPATHEIREIG